MRFWYPLARGPPPLFCNNDDTRHEFAAQAKSVLRFVTPRSISSRELNG